MYRAIRGLESEIDLESLRNADRPDPIDAWESSEFAGATAERGLRVDDPADRLRFVDVALRMRPQCVELQRRLCAFVGLGYSAPIADERVVAAALSEPVGDHPQVGKRALREFVAESLGGRWGSVPKSPIASQNWSRAPQELPAEWRELLAAAPDYGFRADVIERVVADLDPTMPWLPRRLVVAATTVAADAAGCAVSG